MTQVILLDSVADPGQLVIMKVPSHKKNLLAESSVKYCGPYRIVAIVKN